MDKLPVIEVSDFVERLSVSGNYQRMVIVADINAVDFTSPDMEGYTLPVRLNAIFIIVILQGKLQIRLDYVPYTVSANELLTIMHTHVIQISELSHDFKAKLLVIERTFLDECRLDKRTPSMLGYMQFRQKPRTTLTPDETAHIRLCFGVLEKKIALRTHSFHREVMQNALVAFLLELANMLVGKKENLPRPTFSRREEIMNQFLQLLFEHAGEQRAVTFYAEKLCITPQYLSLVLKELTGKTANKWIEEALIMEAKIRLKTPQATIQQVAEALNFSDQSTFGKFFKKHTGLSPTEFRRY
ncbi:MAG: helix-turn-helix domain-containing protein [Clostridiales bacterium]|jgi:AraC-like DNA-binding protein|nr:helix-turn-helix domain-containing protein [Clostridiales bacterium]